MQIFSSVILVAYEAIFYQKDEITCIALPFKNLFKTLKGFKYNFCDR